MPTFYMSMFMYINVCIYWYVYKQEEADVPKLRGVHIGCVRPKIYDVAFIYWQLNLSVSLTCNEN